MLKLLKSSVGARSDIGLAGAFIEVSAVCRELLCSKGGSGERGSGTPIEQLRRHSERIQGPENDDCPWLWIPMSDLWRRSQAPAYLTLLHVGTWAS